MSKLEIISNALQTTQNVFVFGPGEKKSFGEGRSVLQHDAHHVWYTVAPIVANYSISELNKWFKGLIHNYKSLNPPVEGDFARFGDRMQLGFLRFDETDIGYTETVITRVQRIIDEDFLKELEGFEYGLGVKTERIRCNLGRMIMIYGCPSEEIAKQVFDEGGKCYSDVNKMTD